MKFLSLLIKSNILILVLSLSNGVTLAQDDQAPDAVSASTEFKSSFKPLTPEEAKAHRKFLKESSKKKETISALSRNLLIPVTLYNQGGYLDSIPALETKVYLDGSESDQFRIVRKQRRVVLLLDVSPSSFGLKKKGLVEFTEDFAEAIKGSASLDVYIFSEKVKRLKRNKKGNYEFKKQIKPGPGTGIYDAVEKMVSTYPLTQDEETLILFVSDGVDTTSKSTYYRSLQQAETANLRFSAAYLKTSQQYRKKARSSRDRALMRRGSIVTSILERQLQMARPQGLGTSLPEYRQGISYLDDLAEVTGGRGFQMDDLLGKPLVIKNLVAKYLVPQYFLEGKVQIKTNTLKRLKVKVEVRKPNITVLTKKTLVIRP